MSIDISGQDKSLSACSISIQISLDHPLIQLGNTLPWQDLMDIVIDDLKSSTSKGFWWMGRKIKVRMHLAAYFLQRIYNITDRKTEYQIRDNAAFQLFCGRNIVEGWHAPDHTKIEGFRSRLSPETQRTLANSIAQIATNLGFADPTKVDFDSTVQEANIAYPSDAQLMSKLTSLGGKFINYVKESMENIIPMDFTIDLKSVKEKARSYFFLAKNKTIEVKREVFNKLHKLVKKQMLSVVKLCNDLPQKQIDALPWNIRRAFDQIKNDAWRYLLDVGHFTRTHSIKAGKILSFHAKDIACIKKGKAGKDKEFGRVFQLGRIGGNFMTVLDSNSIQMHDKVSFIPLLIEHENLFGKGVLETVAVDKGYWSRKNKKHLLDLGVTAAGLQKPANMKQNTSDLNLQDHLRDRRAGIEPMIGHAKQGGQLGKSRMKSDTATLAAGYGSILGLNLRQMIRCQQGKVIMS